MIRVCIGDDHELIREGFKRLIDREPDMECCAEAADGAAILRLLGRIEADVLVLDLNLPDRPGLEVLKDVLVQDPALGVLVLSFHPEEQYARRCMKAGARGYLSKDRAGGELIQAIRCLARGERYLSPEAARSLAYEDLGGAEGPPHTRLSDREFELMVLFAGGQNLRQASESLGLSINTVSSYKSRLWKKMGFTSNAELIRYVVSQGLL